MKMGSLFDDERLKLVEQPVCSHCGAGGPMAIDHLIPRAVGGTDRADNLIRACRPCNSSKGKRDLLTWHDSRGTFPRLMVLRRYLKIVADVCKDAELLGEPLDDPRIAQLPVDLSRLPRTFPPLSELEL
jgi:hypothetical protein